MITHGIMLRRQPRRSAIIMVTVLVCMLVASSIALGLLHSAMRERRQMGRELQMVQTRWLLDGGLRHARIQLAGSTKYTGETIRFPVRVGRDEIDGQIEIAVSKDGQRPGVLVAQITARIGDEQTNITQLSKSFEYTAPESEEQE